MFEPVWLTLAEISGFAELVGGDYPDHFIEAYPHKIGDLEAGLYRPVNRYAYEGERDMATLAAHYVYGIGKAHAFSDGNKRIAYMAASVFLERNFLFLDEPEEGFYAQPVFDLIADKLPIEGLAEIFANHIELIEEGAV